MYVRERERGKDRPSAEVVRNVAHSDSTLGVKTEWAHICYNFTLIPHSFILVSHRMYTKKKPRYKSQYQEQSAA